MNGIFRRFIVGIGVSLALAGAPVFASTVSQVSSSFVTSATQVSADGLHTATLTATIRDTNGNTMSGKTVYFHAPGPITFSNTSAVTNGYGVASVTVASTHVDGGTIFNASVDGMDIGQSVNVMFVPPTSVPVVTTPTTVWTQTVSGAPSASYSSITTDQSSYALGNAVKFSVTLKDDLNRPVQRYATLVLTRPNGTSWSSESYANSNGLATYTVTPSTEGTWQAYVEVGGSRLGISTSFTIGSYQTNGGTYQNTNISPSNSSVSWTHGTIPADQSFNFSVNATARDFNNRGVGGQSMNVNWTTGGVSMLPSSVNTDVNGSASVQVRFPYAGTFYFSVVVGGTTLVSGVSIIVSGTTDYSSYTNYSSYPSNCVSAPGNLVKLPDDGNPYTQSDTTVYYYGRDCQRHSFPNADVYFSWYPNFDGVQTVSPDVLSQMPLGKNVTFRPGKSLVKMYGSNRVYLVTHGGMLRWVPNESYGDSMFGYVLGSNWKYQVHDLSDAFVTNYQYGSTLDYSVNLQDEVSRAPTIDANF